MSATPPGRASELVARPTRALLGLNLPPDREHLALTARAIEEDAEFFEITPETLWRADLTPSSAYASVLDVVRRSGRPVAGHGTGFSPGTAGGAARDDARLAAIARDHAAFGFAWYSEHLALSESDGLVAELPLPLPPTASCVQTVAARVARLAEVVPGVALENQASLFALGDPREEPEFLNAICRAAGCGLLLDLHNVFVQCRNFGMDLDAYLGALDLAVVVEIHVAGGSESDPGWLASRRVFRLDSHDGPVPEQVWRALADLVPRCPALRGVVLERNPGSVDEANLAAYDADVRRLREILC